METALLIGSAVQSRIPRDGRSDGWREGCSLAYPHLVKLVNATTALICQDKGAGFKSKLSTSTLLVQGHRETCRRCGIAAYVNPSRRHVGHRSQQLD